jgi:hypothetical protein
MRSSIMWLIHCLVNHHINWSPSSFLYRVMMHPATDNPTSCKICAVICFLDAKYRSAAEIHCELWAVYGQNVMSEGTVRQWCRMYKDWRANKWSRQTAKWSAICSVWLSSSKCWPKFVKDRTSQFLNFHVNFHKFTHSSLWDYHRLGYHKFSVRWVLKMLMGVHKTQRMASASTFLVQYHKDGCEFLNHTV